jgi:hypothetical protein
MGWSTTTQQSATLIPEGEFPAVLTEIREMPGQHGTMVRLDFMITGEDEWEGRSLSGLANSVLSENSKLGQWVTALIGRTPAVGERVDSKDVIHRDCRIVVRHRVNSDGKVFANVVSILRPR